MTIQEAIRMQWNGPTNPRIQELAVSQNVNKAPVELTFDEIAGAYSEEEDPRSVFRPMKHDQSDYRARVYVTHEAFSHMQWPIRMNWRTVATMDILHQGDKLQSMGT
jgi:hypothetical protein